MVDRDGAQDADSREDDNATTADSIGAPTKPPAIEFPPPLSGRFVTICRMRPMEAELARAKLEAEGIRCFVRDASMAIAHPLLVSEVPILVDEASADRAKAILARPAADDGDGEYVEEEWRCPRCHRKSVDLLPLSGPWRVTRIGCLGALGLPILLPVLGWALGRRAAEAMNSTFESGVFVWLAVVVVLSLLLIFKKRRKRCRECGHTW